MKDANSPLIKYSKLFNKQFKALSLEIKIAFREARELFIDNPNHQSLRNHKLKEELQGYRSIDVTNDYRAVFKEKLERNQEIITFYMIGAHEDLYGS